MHPALPSVVRRGPAQPSPLIILTALLILAALPAAALPLDLAAPLAADRPEPPLVRPEVARQPTPLSQPPLVSPRDAAAVLEPAGRSALSEPTGLGAENLYTEEVLALAYGLRYDWRLIYEYVRNTIDFLPYYGSHKGATPTLLDGRGNAFDQASLMITLLRASGYTASYAHGQVELSASEIANWLGVPSTATIVGQVLSSGGIPATVYVNGQGNLDSVVLDHVWVLISGVTTNYAFDPSFKAYSNAPPIAIGAAMGYDRASFLARAASGMTSTVASIKGVNRANIRADLAACAAALAQHIRTNYPAASPDDVIGTRRIVEVRNEPLVSALPREVSLDQVWTDVPAGYQATLRVEHAGIDSTLAVPAICGRRLTLYYDGTGSTRTPYLLLDGSAIDVGSAVPVSTYQPMTLTADHPYAAGGGTFADESHTVYPRVGGVYLIAQSWGSTGRATLEGRRRRLSQLLSQGTHPQSVAVIEATLASIADAWMAETYLAMTVGDRLGGAITIPHHNVGMVGQDLWPFVFMDLPLMYDSIVGLDGSNATAYARYFSRSGANSAFEWGAIDQQQPVGAVSTVKIFDLAGQRTNTFFEATAANWAGTVKPQLTGYTAATITNIEDLLASGHRVILPEKGNLADGAWTGAAYIPVGPQTNSVAYMISGGLKGGHANSSTWADGANAKFEQTWYKDQLNDHPNTLDPVDLYTGCFIDRTEDLSLGPASSPFRLDFGRVYSSGSRYDSAGIGNGWRHNWDLRASTASDGFRGLGEAGAVDAAAAVASLYVTTDILKSSLGLDRIVFASLCHRWFMERLIDNVVNVRTLSGTRQYTLLADGTYQPDPGGSAVLTRPGGGYRLRMPHGDVLEFGTNGLLTAATDPNSNTVSLTYAGGRLAAVANARGRQFTLAYNASNWVSRVADSAGRAVSYAYDSSGNLVAVTNAEGAVTRFGYTSRGLVAAVYRPAYPSVASVSNTYDAFDRITSQTDGDGRTWTYYVAGNRTEDVDPTGHSVVQLFDRRGQALASIDPDGHETSFEYDGQGRMVRATRPEGNAETYAYDTRHNMTNRTLLPKPGSGLAPLVESFEYDPVFSRTVRTVDPAGRTTAHTLDARGNLVRVDKPAVGGTSPAIVYAVRPDGQLDSITDEEGRRRQFAYDPATGDLIADTVDAQGLSNTTSYAYDATGNLVRVTRPGGAFTRYAFSPCRRLTAETSPLPFGHRTLRLYDASGNVTQVVRQADDTGALWHTNAYVHSPADRLLRVTDELGQVSSNRYNSVGLLECAWDPTGAATLLEYAPDMQLARVRNALGTEIEARTYSSNGLLLRTTNALGQATVRTYDGFDRLVAVTEPGGLTTAFEYAPARDAAERMPVRVTDPAGGVTLREYDALGRPTRETDPDGVAQETGYTLRGQRAWTRDALGRTTWFASDGTGRQTAMTNHLGRVWRWTFDADGRPSGNTDARGVPQALAYDELGRCTSVVDNASRAIVSRHDPYGRVTNRTACGLAIGAAFDAGGNRLRLTDPRGATWSFSYDAAGRLTNSVNPLGERDRHAYDAAGRRTNHVDALGRSFRFAYDPLDRPTALVLPGAGGSISTEYDAAGRVARRSHGAWTNAFTWDAAGRKLSAGGPYGLTVSNAYTAAGRLASVTYPGGRTVAYRYDAAGRLTNVTDWTGRRLTLGYDALGRLAARTYPNGTRLACEYDENDHLTLLRHETAGGAPLVERRIAYNAFGQILSESRESAGVSGALPDLARHAAFTPANRLDTVVDGTVTNRYFYDTAGCLTGRTWGATAEAFTYDAMNRLTAWTAGGVTGSCAYDADGNRVSVSRPGSTNRYLVDEGRVWCRLDPAGQPERFFVYAGSLAYSLDAAGRAWVYHADERGSVEIVTDDSGAVIQSYAYSPYGEVLASSGALTNEFQFAGTLGVMTDPGGLCFMRRRYYDPRTARFLTQDPLGVLERLNLYAYAAGDPLSQVDPDGRLERYGIKPKGVVDKELAYARMMGFDSPEELEKYQSAYQNYLADQEVMRMVEEHERQLRWEEYQRAKEQMNVVDVEGHYIPGICNDGVYRPPPPVAIEAAGNIGPLGVGIAVSTKDGTVVLSGGPGFDPVTMSTEVAKGGLLTGLHKSLGAPGGHIAIVIPQPGKDINNDVLLGWANTIEGGSGGGGGVIINDQGEWVGTKLGVYTPGGGYSRSYGATLPQIDQGITEALQNSKSYFPGMTDEEAMNQAIQNASTKSSIK